MLACRQGFGFLVDEIAFVDLQGCRGKHLAGGIRRAGILAAVAHDAGVSIHNLRPAQVFQAGGAKLFDAFIFKVEGV